MGQELDLADAEFCPGDCPHEVLDLLGCDVVHAHERSQGDHVRIDRQRAAEQHLPDRGSHLFEEIATCADPGLATREHLGHVGERHGMCAHQLVHELSLLEDCERALAAGTQQAGDTLCRVFAPRDIRHTLDAQLRGTPMTAEAIQEETALRRTDAAQRFFDPTLGDRSQQARFGSAVAQATTLVAEIQAAAFHRFAHHGHLEGLQGGC